VLSSAGRDQIAADEDERQEHQDENAETATVRKAHKAPRSVTFGKELPKTATSKIQKYVLRAQQPAIAPQ